MYKKKKINKQRCDGDAADVVVDDDDDDDSVKCAKRLHPFKTNQPLKWHLSHSNKYLIFVWCLSSSYSKLEKRNLIVS